MQRDEFTILETNWCFQKAKIDIIAKKDGFLIFTEIKTRVIKKFVKASDAINKNKIALYKDAVEGYLKQYPSEDEISFDIVNIMISKDETQIEHIHNAF